MASSLIAKMIFFLVTIFLSISVAFLFINMVQTNEVAMNQREDLLEAKLKSKMVIESFAYNDVEDQIILYLRNTGSQKILPRHLNVYLDNERINKSSDFGWQITTDTNLINEQYWDNGEILRIVINKSIPASSEYTILVTENHGEYAIVKKQPEATTASY